MSPGTIDIVLTVLVILFVLNGLYQGLVHMIGAFVGLIVGVAVASRWDTVLATWITNATGWNRDIAIVISFIVILIAFTRVFGWALHLFERTFKLLKLPLVGLVNHLGGGILGFIEGIFVLGATLILMVQLPPFADFSKSIQSSNVAISLMTAAQILLPLVPKSIRDLYEVKKA